MSPFKLILIVVPYGFGEKVTKAAVSAGAGGGTLTMARGLADGKIAQLLGVGDTSKDVAYIIVPTEKTQKIIESVKNITANKKYHFGALCAIDVSYFANQNSSIKIETETDRREETNTNEKDSEAKYMAQANHQVITVIANKGYSDDIMDAARKAGAGGGTIITARGTAKPDDEKFLGMEIVPEKEMLYIITENSHAQKIMDAIQSLECLSKPGSGIVFAVPATDFSLLGKEKNA